MVGGVYDTSDIYSYVQRLHRIEEDFYDGDIGERLEKFKHYAVVEVPAEKISLDEYSLDEDRVDEYKDVYSKTKTYPPIVLGNYSKKFGLYNIIDGNHRANALNDLGIKKIICFVGKK